METKHLSYFKVENFKRFDSLEVKDIGQFNLIVGDNNVGKTTLLEALLFDEKNYNQFLNNIYGSLIQNRNIKPKNINISNYLDFTLNDKTKQQSFFFKFSNSEVTHILLISKKIRTKLSHSELDELGGRLSLHNQTQHLVQFDLDGKSDLRFTTYNLEKNTTPYFPLINFNSNFGVEVIDFFSKITFSNSKFEELKSDLKYFIPNLISIELNSAIIDGQNTIIIREQGSEEIKPLNQYGDGTLKLFRYLLEFDICQDNRLMIDEIDTGIHYSRMKEFLKKIIQTAKNKNVQLFATTHSKECLQYFTQALQELSLENEGRVIKLADTKSGIKAYTSKYAEFENSLFMDNEIR